MLESMIVELNAGEALPSLKQKGWERVGADGGAAVARACADGAWLSQGEIVGRIDLSLSPLVLLIFLVLFSLYAWWALSGY